MADRRYTATRCPCGDAFCAGCADGDTRRARRYCHNCGIALDVAGGCGICKPNKGTRS